MTRVSIKRLARWGAAGLALAAMLLVPALLAGVRLFAVQTPSMGQVAPVGTLVITTHQPAYQAGDVISFNAGQRTHTHRIVRVQPDGQFITKGDLNGVEDPLPVQPRDVIGKATVILPGLGWLFEGLPWLLLGAIAVYLLTRIGKLPERHRLALRVVGTTLVFCVVVLWLRPWLNIDMLGFTPAPQGGVLMHVVNTGLFPLDALGTRLVSGQDAVVHLAQAGADGRYILTPAPSLEWWQLAILIIICLAPLAASLLVRPESDPEEQEAPVEDRRRRFIATTAIVIATSLVVTAITTSNAWAATTAKVQNTASTAGTATFFTCNGAITSLPAASTFFAYALGTTGTTETDLSGNGRTGRRMASASTSTSVACGNDTPARSITFNGTSQCVYMNSATNTSQTNPNTFSVEAWFRTSAKSNGKIIGFGNVRNTAADTTYDRHLYLDKDGRIVFGVYPGAVKLASTAAGTNYADNAWHHAVGTLSSAGQKLYVDGELVDTNSGVTTAENTTGYWKVGCGNLSNWQNAATADAGSTNLDYSGPNYFTGQIQYAAVYTVALTAQQVKEHYQAGA